jgi:hypothetical protein
LLSVNSAKNPGVPRIGRVMDLAAATLLLIGGVLYVRAYFGLEALRARPLADYQAGMEITRIAEFHALERLSFGGMALAILGVAVAAGAAVIARRASSLAR